MNKEIKIEILKAFRNGVVSNIEVEILLLSKGIILLDLSSQGDKQNILEPLLLKLPKIQQKFTRIICLGYGKNPAE